MTAPAPVTPAPPVDAPVARRHSRPAFAPDGEPVLVIDHLSVAYGDKRHSRTVVSGVDLTVRPGEVVAVVGESGSGKSTTAHALLGLLPSSGQVTAGRIVVGGHTVAEGGAKPLSEKAFGAVRGPVVGLVPQDPMVALNPTLRIGEQVAEALRRRGVPKRSLPAEVVEVLQQAGIADAESRVRHYPHQLSGGQRQRVLIAIALAGRPRLLVADEPTSALDATVQRRILDHLDTVVAETGTALLLITHDLGVALDRADRIVVMQKGRIVEVGTPEHFLDSPHTEYTRSLLGSAPGLGRLPLERVEPGTTPVLVLEGVGKTFHSGRRESAEVLHGVDLTVHDRETVALVGESGSGKTTALRIAMGLEDASAGTITFEGQDLTTVGRAQLRELRRRFQLVHQNPYAALDPRFTIRDVVAEPLDAFRIARGADRTQRVADLLDRVGLPSGFAERRAAELSGGQRQRVAIARALALEPRLVLLDEPVSALDVSVQAQILDLLSELQHDLGLSYLLVSHDLAVVREISHRVAVLAHGRVVETGPTDEVLDHPTHEITRSLVEAIPGAAAVNA